MNTDTTSDRESGTSLLPKFDANGLITAVVVSGDDNAPLMLAHMNAAALDATIETGVAHFYSRSRKELWRKGATSGNELSVKEMRIDCDQDAVWLTVEIAGHGAACHTGRRSCFYRRIVGEGKDVQLQFTGDEPIFDPEAVYPADK